MGSNAQVDIGTIKIIAALSNWDITEKRAQAVLEAFQPLMNETRELKDIELGTSVPLPPFDTD